MSVELTARSASEAMPVKLVPVRGAEPTDVEASNTTTHSDAAQRQAVVSARPQPRVEATCRKSTLRGALASAPGKPGITCLHEKECLQQGETLCMGSPMFYVYETPPLHWMSLTLFCGAEGRLHWMPLSVRPTPRWARPSAPGPSACASHPRLQRRSGRLYPANPSTSADAE